MMRYPAEVGQFLTYRVSISMQWRDNSYTVPIVKNNKLAGILLHYDPRSQVLDAIPAPIIAHFLKDAETDHYRGFPSVVRFFSDARPTVAQFCRSNRKAGRCLRHERRTEHASRESRIAGGRHRGVGNNEIDQNGNYVDPLYGKLDFTNL